MNSQATQRTHLEGEKIERIFNIAAMLKGIRTNIEKADNDLESAERLYKTAKRRYDAGEGSQEDVRSALEQFAKASAVNCHVKSDRQIAKIAAEEILAMEFSEQH